MPDAPSGGCQAKTFTVVPSSATAHEGAGAPAAAARGRYGDQAEGGAVRDGPRTTLIRVPSPLTVEKIAPSPPAGWHWKLLVELARLESGHTPSRYHPEWWGGDIPWISLADIRDLDGTVARETRECTNEAGIANSAARVLPEGTVVLSRTASVGFVAVMGRPMATSQDFVNWVCGPELDPWFLAYLLTASRGYIRSLASGAVHRTVYMPTVQAFRVCIPALDEQRRIVRMLRHGMAQVERARAAAEAQMEAASALRSAILRSAFSDAREKK